MKRIWKNLNSRSCSLVHSYKIEENGCQTGNIKGANKDIKIYIDHAQSFILRSNTTHELPKCYDLLVPRSIINSYCVL